MYSHPWKHAVGRRKELSSLVGRWIAPARLLWGIFVTDHRGWLDPRTVPVSGRGFVAPAVVTSSRLAVSARHDSNALE